ncbi:MAG: ABC transporter substrate-binding protein [Pseudomonadota bacterium]
MRRVSRRLLVACLVALGAVVPLVPASALEPETARNFIVGLAEETTAVLTGDMSDGERQERVITLLNEGFDLPFIGRLVLGPTYRSLTPEQQQAYTAAFERFVLATYGRRFEDYNGQEIVVLDAQPEGQQDVRVRSQIRGGGQPTLTIDWRVRERDGEMRIIDVGVEGVSMAISQRSEFNAVVQRQGIDGLIALLNDRASAAPS